MMDASLLAEAHRRYSGRALLRGMAGEFVERRLKRLHLKQRAYVEDRAKRKVACTTRRAGKTTGIAEECVIGAVESPGTKTLYATLTRERAKDLLWPELKRINFEEQAGVKFNEVELTATLPEQLGSSVVKLVGADKAKEIEKRRGDKYRRARVDEAQAFGPYLKTFCEDVLTPALLDHDGDLGLCGTPGPVPTGYFHDVSTGRLAGWSVHRWSVLDNTYLPHARRWLEEQKKARGWTDDDPTYRREWKGEWVSDAGALVYRYDPLRNSFKTLPDSRRWVYALGVDLGSGGDNDPMAAHLWGWCPESPCLWEIESWKSPAGEQATSRMLMEGNVLPWQQRYGGFVVQTIDTGGGGKLTANDIEDRWGIKFEPAKKTEKAHHIRLMNEDMVAGLLKVKDDGPLAAEWRELPKNPEDPREEHPAWPNHSSDSALYPWRLSRHHWFALPPPEPPKPGTDAYAAFVEQQLEDEAQRQWDEEQEERATWAY